MSQFYDNNNVINLSEKDALKLAQEIEQALARTAPEGK